MKYISKYIDQDGNLAAGESAADGNAVQLCLTAVCRAAVPAAYASERKHADLGGVDQAMSRRYEVEPLRGFMHQLMASCRRYRFAAHSG